MKITISIENQDWLIFEGDKESLAIIGKMFLQASEENFTSEGKYIGNDDPVIYVKMFNKNFMTMATEGEPAYGPNLGFEIRNTELF